ncbi:MAG: type I pullulanase [Bacteroidales bacterium]|nr:type I pullulanase [Bacteroidales bacterium]
MLQRKINLFTLIAVITMTIVSCQITGKQELTDGYPVYHGDDLGVYYSPEKTTFRVWAPSAEAITVKIYDQGHEGNVLETLQMEKDVNGTWLLELEGDWKDKYYTYQAQIDGELKLEVPDPYARAVGVNGNRGMIVDLASTNPEGWEIDDRPELSSFADMVIWEIHMRDFSIHPSSGIKNRGKYLAFTETGTSSPEGHKTGIDHLVELGISHVHLLPVYDFYTIDETRLDEPQFNWGYDPKNYNVPQGSYSTDPFDGNVRIREFKKMVQSLHNHGIRVIMDVVYNHMYNAQTSAFENLVPGYYFRMNPDGTFSDGASCGNETASEKAMMRKFMVESVKYWAQEYRIDGFRFDLMGLHDIETMNLIRKELHDIDPTIFLYGEGWTAGDTPLPEHNRAIKVHAESLNGVAVFSDDIRDAIRGPWWDNDAPGFMAGQSGLEESIKFGVVASTRHPQINYSAVNYSDAPYAANPLQTITYVTCHDNPCLWDKVEYTCIDCTKEEMLDMQKFANAIVLTSQGVPLLHAGEEIVRTKFGEHNSYNLPDSINQLVWHNKHTYRDVFDFYKDMISLRLNHPAFRMPTAEMVQKHLRFFDIHQPLLVGFHIGDHANGDKWKDILVFYNANAHDVEVDLPEGDWVIIATKYSIEETGSTVDGYNQVQNVKTTIPDRSIMILVDKASV